MEKIGILGGGAGAQACCVDLSLAGHMVNLYELPEFKANIEPIRKRGGIRAYGGVEGFAKLNLVTTNINEAIEDVDVILVIVPAFGRKIFSKVCIPHLKSRQSLVFLGSNGGCLQFVKALKDLGVEQHMGLGETQTLPYSTRLVGPAEVIVYRNQYLLTAAFPSKYTNKIVTVLKKIFPFPHYRIIAARSVLETMFWHSLGHPLMLICNLSRIDRGEDWLIYRDGMTPSIKRLINAMNKEKEAVMQALDIKPRDLHPLIAKKEQWKTFVNTAKGPSSTKVRFIAEDIQFLAVTLASLGNKIGVKTPLIRSLVRMASIINETDYWKSGATLEKLGISELDIDELKTFVLTGKID